MPLNHTSQFAELTDDQFKLIGKVFVEWVNIEIMQKLVLSRLLFSPDFISRTYCSINARSADKKLVSPAGHKM